MAPLIDARDRFAGRLMPYARMPVISYLRRSGCLPASLRLREPAADPLSEADLSAIWAGQRFPPEALRVVDGRCVEVLNPGRLNGGAGPDFRDAVFRLDGKEQRGDVELHVRASFFRGHGHHTDHAYDRVGLHVVYLADDGIETTLAGGGRAPVASFAPWLAGRVQELQSWLTAPELWRDPCRDAARTFGDEQVERVLLEAGRRRLAAKAGRLALEARTAGEGQALWAALLDALGLGGDREGFRRLAQALQHAQALLVYQSLGVAGLEGALLTVAGLGEAPWQLAGLLPRALWPPLQRPGRPLNRPERRLSALAALFERAGGDFVGWIRASVQEAQSARELVAAWCVADASGGPALLGRDRAQELVLNVALPFAAGRGAGVAEKAWSLAQQLPAASVYGRTAFLEANLQRSDGKRRARGALEQQGLISLVEEWCKRGGCGRCPLS